jgi:Domain of unknown function (DUF4476)
MRHLLVTFLLGFASLNIIAQQNHFIYLQTENKQSFYVKLDKKIFSSASTGFLIIPKLLNGEVTFTLGFPKNEWPEQNFTIHINSRDVGYLLKNFDEKGWSLFDLQSLQMVQANKATSVPVVVAEQKTITEPKIVEEQKVIVKETTATKNAPIDTVKTTPSITQIDSKANTSTPQPNYCGNKISKLSTKAINQGTTITYLDNQTEPKDTITIDIFLPTEKPVDTIISANTPNSQNEVKVFDVNVSNTEKNTKPFEIIVADDKPKKLEDVKQIEPKDVVESPKPKPLIIMINSDCKKTATEKDFISLRKKMIDQNSEDEMIEVAKKYLKQKCFYVEQVKNLSQILIKEEAKYKLFDAAYPFVVDTSNFKTLQSQLKEEYFISRFKAMVKQ